MLKTLKRRIAELGPHFDPAVLAQTLALYQPLLPPTPDGVTVQHDIAYASDERQRLDLYAPAGAAGLQRSRERALDWRASRQRRHDEAKPRRPLLF